MYDFPTNPAFGTVVNVPDGSYRVWDSHKWMAAPSANLVVPGGSYLPLIGGTMSGPVTLTGMSLAWNQSLANPSPIPGYVFSSRYGTQAAVDIFAKMLNVPPRNTFNALEGVLTLPATVTDFNTYHQAIGAYVSNKSSSGVGYGVGSFAVAEADGCVTGAFGSISVDSPKSTTINAPSGQYNNVRLQNEFDWYTNNPGTSVRGTLHDGYFYAAPSTGTNLIAFLNNLFIGAFAIGTGYFNGTVMTVVGSFSSGGPLAVGMHLEGTGVDSTANITITSFGTGTGGAGTYNISANVGVVGSAGSPVTIRATSTYQWNTTFASPDGVSISALDVGQRNFAVSNSFGDRSQYVNWRYTNVAPDTVSGQANERLLQQWVEPIAGVSSPQATPPDTGGVLYLQNWLQAQAPASYGIQNWNWNNAAFVSKNNANTGWIDALHVEGNDRVVLGAGSNSITEIATSQGIQVEVIDNGTAVVNAIGMSGATATTPGYIHMVGGGGTLALQHTGGPTTVGGPFSYTATGGTVSRSAQARAADVANILDFGGNADFNGTTGTDNAGPFAAAQATGKCVYIPAGNYFFASTPATATTALVVRGDGRWLTSLIFGTGATNGLVASLASYRQTTSITGLTIATLGNETGAAIKVSYPDADASLYPYADHLVIRDVTISGWTQMATGWAQGIALTNCTWAAINDVLIVGRRSGGGTAADYQHMTDGVHITNGAVDVGMGFINNIQVYEAVNGIHLASANTMEAFNLSQFNLVEVGTGVLGTFGTSTLGVSVTDGHINAFAAGINLSKVNDSNFANLLIYKHPLSVTDCTGIALSGGTGVLVSNVTMKNQTSDASVSGQWYGVSCVNMTYVRLVAVSVFRPTAGIVISGTSAVISGEVTSFSTFTNATPPTVAVNDTSGNANTISSSPLFAAYTNSGALAPNLAGVWAAVTPTMNVLAGQRFQVGASVSMTNGGTAGDALTTVAKFTGTATVVAGSTGATVAQRMNIAASSSLNQSPSGIFTVTASGTLVMGVLAQLTTSTGTLAANAAQLTIEAR